MHVGGELVLTSLPPKARERLRLKISCPNHRYIRLIQMGKHPGAEPQRIEATVEMPDGSIHVPRGAIALVKELLEKDGLSPRMVKDERTDGSPLALGVLDFSMRDYQGESANALVTHLQGLVVLPCGTGKTRLGVGATALLRRTTLVLVPTADLADQWEVDVRKHLKVSPGMLSESRKEVAAGIVIAVIDSAIVLLEQDPAWGRQFGFVIIDEAHMTAAPRMQRALRLLPARIRLGLSATPDREDGLTKIVDWSFGPRLLERTTAEMIKLGHLMPADIEFVESGWRFSYEGPEGKRTTAMEKELSEDLSRNALIADRAAADAEAGETVLVLCNRREHTKTIADMVMGRGVTALACTGGTSKRVRKGTITSLREGYFSVMCATSLADQGLDIQRLSRVILAYPQKARGRTTQRLGRLLRQWEGKKPKLIDITDEEVPTLQRRARERKRVYKEAGLIR